MTKYKKRRRRMIDMSDRWEMEVVHEEYTLEDETIWSNEMDEINKRAAERMKRYEYGLKTLFSSALSDGNTIREKDADYFIHEYGDKISEENSHDMDDILNFYNKYFEEQEN